jgi:glycosyltransferase involved in cell wall biosynthesis
VPGRPDIAIVSLGTTPGWRVADAALAEQIRAAGATCQVVPVTMGAAGRLRVTMALTDVVEALAAVRAARGLHARATIFSSITAALLQPPRGPHGIRFDTIAATSRPGIGGAWQRRREPGVLARADVLLPLSDSAATAAESAIADAATPRQIVLPPPLARAAEPARDAPDAVAYAANPEKRGLDLLCRAWAEGAPAGARLVVGGISRDEALRWLNRQGVEEPAGIAWEGALPRERWLALVGAARVFVSAARFEDWGLAQMEALAAGTPLVAVAASGPNPALPLARALAPSLVAAQAEPAALAAALRAGLAMDERERATYAAEARRLTTPYSEEALRAVVAREVLPALLSSSS